MRFRYSTIAMAVTLSLLFTLFTVTQESTAQTSDKDGTYFHIFGEVSNPGSYVVNVAKTRATLRRAIWVAGGTTDEAMASYTIILREPPSGGRRQKIKVDLKELMDGNVEDIPLMDDDIIIVPRDKAAKPKNAR